MRSVYLSLGCLDYKSAVMANPCTGYVGTLPLVTLMALHCNRPAFVQLALDAAGAQTYPNIEIVVVDDSPPTVRSLGRRLGVLHAPARVPVRHVRLTTRATIGAKRNAALAAARGAIVMHWDDDDFHPPGQVSALACPIVRNETDITALNFAYLATLSAGGASFARVASQKDTDVRGQMIRPNDGQTFLGSLAYSRRVVDAFDRAPIAARPKVADVFANVSLSEDLLFVERALQACFRMLPIPGVPFAYTRHAGGALKNTWAAVGVEQQLSRRAGKGGEAPPAFVTEALRRAYVAAEADANSRAVCMPIAKHPPKELLKEFSWYSQPNMPQRCCPGREVKPMRRPCVLPEGGPSAKVTCFQQWYWGGVLPPCQADTRPTRTQVTCFQEWNFCGGVRWPLPSD